MEHRSRDAVPTWLGCAQIDEEPAPWVGLSVIARGELDVAAAGELRERLGAAPVGGRILLDLSAATFLDSTCLAAIVAAKRRMGPSGRVALVTTVPYVLLVLEAAGMDSVLGIFATRDDAESHLLT